MNASLPYIIRVKCPYCQLENVIRIEYDKNTSHPQTHYCDIEEGGCDKLFAVQLTATISQKVYAMQEVTA